MINAVIKGVSLQQWRNSLVVVATLSVKQGARKAHQQRHTSGHEADAHGFKLAHKQALMLASANASGSFNCEDWTDQPVLPVHRRRGI